MITIMKDKYYPPFEKMDLSLYLLKEIVFMALHRYPEIINGNWYHPRHCERVVSNCQCYYSMKGCKNCSFNLFD